MEHKWSRTSFHPKIGFGALDATKLVNLAKNWTNVGPHRKCIALKFNGPGKNIPRLTVLTMSSVIKPHQCANPAMGRTGEEHLNKLEHVQLVVTMSTAVRGNIKLLLTSPSGTTSKLLNMRPNDKWTGMNSFGYMSTKEIGIKNWAFTTVNFWDEYPYGKWKLEIFNGGDGESPISPVTRLKKVRFKFYGTGSKGAPVNHSFESEDEDTVDTTGESDAEVELRQEEKLRQEDQESMYHVGDSTKRTPTGTPPTEKTITITTETN